MYTGRVQLQSYQLPANDPPTLSFVYSPRFRSLSRHPLDQPPLPLLALLTSQDLHGLSVPYITESTPQRRARDKIAPALKHTGQIPRGDDRLRQDRQEHRIADEQQLQERVDLADLRRMDLGTGQAEVPVSRERLGRRQADPAEVDRGDGERDVAAQDDHAQPQRQHRLDCQADHRDGHQGLVGHRVDHSAHHRLRVVPPRQVPVHRVRHARVEE